MYFFDAISYPFNSRSWAGKAFVAFLLMAIPFVNILGAIVLSGYTLRTAREILEGNRELPDFDFADDLMKGFIITITSIVYQIPFMFLSSQIQRTASGRIVMNVSGSVAILLVVVGIISSLFLLMAIARYIVTDDFAVFVDFSGNFALMSRNIGTILMYGLNTVLFGLVGGLLTVLGFIVCVIPGIIVGIMLTFGRAYLLARFVEGLGLSMDGEKFKNDRYKNDFAR